MWSRPFPLGARHNRQVLQEGQESVERPRWPCLLKCLLFERKIGVEIDLCGSTDSCPSQRAMTAGSLARLVTTRSRRCVEVRAALRVCVVHVCCTTTTYFETRYWTESELSRPPQPYGNRSVRSFGLALESILSIRLLSISSVEYIVTLRPFPSLRTRAPLPWTKPSRRRAVISDSCRPV